MLLLATSPLLSTLAAGEDMFLMVMYFPDQSKLMLQSNVWLRPCGGWGHTCTGRCGVECHWGIVGWEAAQLGWDGFTGGDVSLSQKDQTVMSQIPTY